MLFEAGVLQAEGKNSGMNVNICRMQPLLVIQHNSSHPLFHRSHFVINKQNLPYRILASKHFLHSCEFSDTSLWIFTHIYIYIHNIMF